MLTSTKTNQQKKNEQSVPNDKMEWTKQIRQMRDYTVLS
jgi:hypothetical protein